MYIYNNNIRQKKERNTSKPYIELYKDERENMRIESTRHKYVYEYYYDTILYTIGSNVLST